MRLGEESTAVPRFRNVLFGPWCLVIRAANNAFMRAEFIRLVRIRFVSNRERFALEQSRTTIEAQRGSPVFEEIVAI